MGIGMKVDEMSWNLTGSRGRRSHWRQRLSRQQKDVLCSQESLVADQVLADERPPARSKVDHLQQATEGEDRPGGRTDSVLVGGATPSERTRAVCGPV